MWTDVKKISSANEHVFKYVFEKSNAVAESVLYKYPTFEVRTVICCSTMSGCPVGCRFCGAGDNFVRSLNAGEIFSQPKKLLEETQVKVEDINRLQIMFMSMGEPLLNMRELAKACKMLHAAYPKAKLLISTSAPSGGNYALCNKISQEIDQIGLQFSVHESTDDARQKLIPSDTLSLKEMAERGYEWSVMTNRKPFFNYCVHENNNTDADADRLLSLFQPEIWNATISVICERDEYVAAANERQKELAATFMEKMLRRGFDTRMFDPAGQDDIGGGCGQLWFVQDWMKKHPNLTKPSLGFDLPKVHTPQTGAS